MSSDQVALGDPLVNSLGMVLVPIPAGEFQMGTSVDTAPAQQKFEEMLQAPEIKEQLDSGSITEADLRARLKWESQMGAAERPQHPVRITQPYYLSSCEVTQKQYEQVMGSCPWQGQPLVKEGPNYAASYVTWDNAVEFCRKLSEQESESYRLPTEAEWEYACRAGAATTWSFGDDGGLLDEYGWYDANAYHDGEQHPHQVGQKMPNAWGLYDMHGNVWEWCQDWYAHYEQRTNVRYARRKQLSVDPKGPEKGNDRVWRGGSFIETADNTRSATRLSGGREDYRPEFAAGFRIVREFKSGE
jgi:formylglycine-generating enzyme required for sulfatase activity